MWHWLHHLFNPHCRECQLAAEENKVCQSCETLKMQLSIANHEKEQMLATILSLSQPQTAAPSPQVDFEKLKPRMTTWNVRKQMLEAEDREKAKILAEQKKQKPIADQIADLEKEVGIEQPEGVKADA
jgi:hypothetical protein